MSKAIEFAARKKALLHQLAGHHAVLKNMLDDWRPPAATMEATMDKSLKVVRYLRHPVVLIGLTLIATVGQRGIGIWAHRGWLVWKTFRAMKRTP